MLMLAFAAGAFDERLPMQSVRFALGGNASGIATSSFHMNDDPEREAAIKRLVTVWKKRLDRSRYIEIDHEPGQKCVDVADYPGWETIVLRKCEYTKTDTAGTKIKRKATAIAHEPTAEQIATWIVDSCYSTGHKQSHYMDRLFAQVICQSSGLFAVAGIMLEDIFPQTQPNGIFENHCFRDGVTIKAGSNWVTADEGPLTQAKMDQCLQQPVTSVLKYARLQGTTRQEYSANGGAEKVSGLAWHDVTRTLYQAALKSDRNELMLAWAKSHLDQSVKKKDDSCVCQFHSTGCVP